MTDLSINSRTNQDPALDRCPTCEHPFSAHDRIGAAGAPPPSSGSDNANACAASRRHPSSTRTSWAQIRLGSASR